MSNLSEVTQVLVTRFSVRLKEGAVLRGQSSDWLFSEERLAKRITLFANLTFPSIVQSSVRPDYYIIVVDAELPQHVKEMLEKLVAPYPWVILHTWVLGVQWSSLGWILELLSISTPYILTSQIDDDDALELGANERLRQGVMKYLTSRKRALWMWFGSSNAWEWDLDVEHDGLGFLKPFSGRTNYWQGVGLSLLVPNEPTAPTSYNWEHSMLEMVFAPFWSWKRLRIKKVFRLRLGVVKRLILGGSVHHIPSLLFGGWIYDVGLQQEAEVDMLISNSGTNLQTIRLKLGHETRWNDDIIEDLKRFGVTHESAQKISSAFNVASSTGNQFG